MDYCYEENRWGERFIPDLNRTAFDNSSATSYFENELDFDPLEANAFTIIVGSDSGLLFKYLCSQTIPESSRIAIIEPSDVFEVVEKECGQWLSTQSLQTDRLRVSLHSSEKLELDLFNGDDNAYMLAGKIRQAQSSCAIQDHQNIYYPLYRDIRAALSARVNELRTTFSRRFFAEQQMKNCVDNHTPMRACPDLGRDKVAVILGGGPSLDNHLDWIALNRSKLFLISVSRISEKLQKLGLIPDLMVSVDPMPINYSAGKSAILWENVPLVSSDHVSHQILKEWPGPHYYTGYRYPWDNLKQIPTDTIESIGPTVGHSAIVIASRLGFSTILLTGIDLCFNASGESHAQDTPEAELNKLPGNYDAQVTTYAGNRAGTSIDFYRSIESLENIGRDFNKNMDAIFNLNIHAAKVHSIDYIDVDQITLPECKPVFDASDYAPLALHKLDALKTQIIGFKRDFEKIQAICLKAKVCIDQIYGKNGKPPNPGYHRRLDALEARLNKINSYAINTIRYYMEVDFARLRKPSGFAEMDQAAMERWARNYYKITQLGGKFFEQALAEALRIIDLRKAEQAEIPDIDYLLEQWTIQDTPGRVKMFYEHLLCSATDDQKIRLETAKNVYVQSLLKKDAQRQKNLISHHCSISKTMKSLRYLRDNNYVTDLQNYSEKLINLDWPYGTIARFIQGVTAEINSNTDVSIALYQQVIDECGEQLNNGTETFASIGTLIEETLTNLTRIYLDRQDGDSALSTLGMLSEITPQYVPSYANLLDMLGNHDSAIELLNIYLENFNHDFRVARQLAQMHEKAGDMDAYEKAIRLSEDIRKPGAATAKAA